MRARTRALTTATAMAAFALALIAPAAQAVDIIESQAPGGTPERRGRMAGGDLHRRPCSAATPNLFFTQAAGHPPKGFTQIIVKHAPGILPGSEARSAT